MTDKTSEDIVAIAERDFGKGTGTTPQLIRDLVAAIKRLSDLNTAMHKANEGLAKDAADHKADNAALRELLKEADAWGFDEWPMRPEQIKTIKAIKAALATDHPGQPLLDRVERYEKALEPLKRHADWIDQNIPAEDLEAIDPETHLVAHGISVADCFAARAALGKGDIRGTE